MNRSMLKPVSSGNPAAVMRAFASLVGLLALLAGMLSATAAHAADEFLEPEKAFRFSARMADAQTAEVLFQVADGYYLYREQFNFSATGATLGPPQIPPGKVKFDETFNKNVETHRGDVRIRLPLQAAHAQAVELSVVSQGCADAGLCYPPMTSVARLDLAAAATLPPATSTAAAAAAEPLRPAGTDWTDSAAVDRVLKSGKFWTIVGAFFVMGLALSFTPCVLPMLPILSSIIVGSNGGNTVSRRRGLALATAYALGMALVYTVFGIAAGLAGEGLAAALQKPLVLAAFAAMLVIFSLSMFDVYELQLPTALSSRLHATSQRLPGGQAAGVFLMGGISALIVSPCVTAPLAGALVFIGQSRDVALGGSALFAMAAGMSVPLLALGASAGAWLPKSGSWMHAVKRAFGLLLIGVAIWIVQPALHAAAVLAAWGLLLLATGFMLRPFDPNPHSGAPRVWLQRALGVAMLALGVMQFVGAASGGNDPLQPLSHLSRPAAGAAGTAAAATHAGPQFQRVKSVAELDAAVKSAGRPVMLDFYADWCVSCKEMERFTFSDPAVAALMGKALLLKADVTANDDDDKALLKRFNLFGPPGTIFFDAAGNEITGVRVIGFQNAERFAQTLRSAGL
jgi:thiol:disulfide interchange protein DsbD